MTVAPDGAGYLNRAGAPVTTQLHITGQYTCAGCGVTETVDSRQLDDADYDLVHTRATTNWSALVHAKTCKGEPDDRP